MLQSCVVGALACNGYNLDPRLSLLFQERKRREPEIEVDVFASFSDWFIAVFSPVVIGQLWFSLVLRFPFDAHRKLSKVLNELTSILRNVTNPRKRLVAALFYNL